MAKRGRPPKKKKEIAPEVKTEGVQKPHDKDIVPFKNEEGGNFDNLDSIYDRYNDFHGFSGDTEEEPQQEAVEPEKTAEVEPEPEIQEPEQPPDEAEQPEKEQPEKAEYVAEPPQQREEPKEKTVPLAALHESREKERKAKEREKEALKEVEDLRERLSVYEERLDTDDEVNPQSDIKRLESDIDLIKRQAAEDKIKKDIDDADAVLRERGMYGFKEIGKNIIGARLNELYAEDPAYATAHDTPEGWIKLWSEEYPKYKKLFIQSDRQDTIQKKTELKKDARLVSSPGVKETETREQKPKPPQTPEEANRAYLAELRAGRI